MNWHSHTNRSNRMGKSIRSQKLQKHHAKFIRRTKSSAINIGLHRCALFAVHQLHISHKIIQSVTHYQCHVLAVAPNQCRIYVFAYRFDAEKTARSNKMEKFTSIANEANNKRLHYECTSLQPVPFFALWLFHTMWSNGAKMHSLSASECKNKMASKAIYFNL